MRVAVIGANGLLGSAIADTLALNHDVVRASRSQGDIQVDITDSDSLVQFFQTLGAVDAVVCAAGAARFRPLSQLTDEDFHFSIQNKLMGQVNLVRVGMDYVQEGGAFTLTSGLLSRHPLPGSAALSLVNAGLEGFIRAAALDLPRNLRVNGVAPGWVSETLSAMGRDPSQGLPAQTLAQLYLESLNPIHNGMIFDPNHLELA